MIEWAVTALQLFLVGSFGAAGAADLWDGKAQGFISMAIAAAALSWWLL